MKTSEKVELPAHNRLVGGSTPPGPTIIFQALVLQCRTSAFCVRSPFGHFFGTSTHSSSPLYWKNIMHYCIMFFFL